VTERGREKRRSWGEGADAEDGDVWLETVRTDAVDRKGLSNTHSSVAWNACTRPSRVTKRREGYDAGGGERRSRPVRVFGHALTT
jgi:hypothetical protein